MVNVPILGYRDAKEEESAKRQGIRFPYAYTDSEKLFTIDGRQQLIPTMFSESNEHINYCNYVDRADNAQFRCISIREVPADITQRGVYYGTLDGFKTKDEYYRFESVIQDPNVVNKRIVDRYFRQHRPNRYKKASQETSGEAEGKRHRLCRKLLYVGFNKYIKEHNPIKMDFMCDKQHLRTKGDWYDKDILSNATQVKTNWRIQTKEGEIIADIALLDDDKKVVYIVEIKDTHKDDEDKQKKLASHNVDEIMFNIENKDEFGTGRLDSFLHRIVIGNPIEPIFKEMNFAIHAYNPDTQKWIGKSDEKYADVIKANEKVIKEERAKQNKILEEEDKKRLQRSSRTDISKRITKEVAASIDRYQSQVDSSVVEDIKPQQKHDKPANKLESPIEVLNEFVGNHRETFTATVSGMKLKHHRAGSEYYKLEWLICFKDADALLINLKNPTKDWVKGKYGMQPKPLSQAGIFILSVIKQGIGIELEEEFIRTEPSIIGKRCTFNFEDASFINNDDLMIKFYKWSLTKVENDVELPDVNIYMKDFTTEAESKGETMVNYERKSEDALNAAVRNNVITDADKTWYDFMSVRPDTCWTESTIATFKSAIMQERARINALIDNGE